MQYRDHSHIIAKHIMLKCLVKHPVQIEVYSKISCKTYFQKHVFPMKIVTRRNLNFTL